MGILLLPLVLVGQVLNPKALTFFGFLNEAALNQVCGVATSDSNNNKLIDEEFDGICIKEDCQTPSHSNVKRSSKFLPG